MAHKNTYIPAMLPVVDTRLQLSQQLTQHMLEMQQLHTLQPLEERLARETLSRAQNLLFEWRGDAVEPAYEKWGIGPLRYCTFQVNSLGAYAQTKASLHTNLGTEALKRVAAPATAPLDSPLYGVLERYLEQFGIRRAPNVVITLVDGLSSDNPLLDEAEQQLIEELLSRAATLSRSGRAECARRIAGL